MGNPIVEFKSQSFLTLAPHPLLPQSFDMTDVNSITMGAPSSYNLNNASAGAVPESATLLLVLGGLAGLAARGGGRGRRR